MEETVYVSDMRDPSDERLPKAAQKKPVRANCACGEEVAGCSAFEHATNRVIHGLAVLLVCAF